jgi:hypothetical protein
MWVRFFLDVRIRAGVSPSVIVMVYFKKYDPRVQLATGRGFIVPFTDIGSSWGVLATADQYLIGELRKAQSEQRGGVMEITVEEFLDLKKKENNPPHPRIYREQVGHLQLRRLYRTVQENSVAAGRPLPFVSSGFAEAKALARPVAKSTFVPKAVAR